MSETTSPLELASADPWSVPLEQIDVSDPTPVPNRHALGLLRTPT